MKKAFLYAIKSIMEMFDAFFDLGVNALYWANRRYQRKMYGISRYR